MSVTEREEGRGGGGGLTLVVHAAVLVLLTCHQGVNLRLAHLLSCGRTDTCQGGGGGGVGGLYLSESIFGDSDLSLTQGGQHDTQLSAHDGAVALLVKDTQTLNVVVDGSLGEGVDLLQHGQEGVKVEPLVGHVCRELGGVRLVFLEPNTAEGV